jgi:6-hydroxynicotinate 3-monooxygenase
MSKPSFAIVGAGLGGLLTGVLLQRAGYECKIYEQSPAIGRVGAGINIAPNSTRIFAALGLEKALRRVGIEPKCKLSRHFETGELMFSWPVKEFTERFNGPFLAFHRADLHAVLASCLRPDTVTVDKRLIGVAEYGSRWSLRFEDGSTVQADAVIGADGVHSQVRSALIGADHISYHGLVAYRALVRAKDIVVPIVDNTKWWAPDRYVMVYCLSERRDLVHFVASTPEVLTEGLTPRDANLDVFHAAFSAFHPEVQALIHAASSVTRWPLIEGVPFSPWSRGNVVLLGDACHATTPHMGQGAGMAFEDAVVLVRCIEEDHGDLPHAFAKYEHNRHARTARIQRESHQNEWAKTKMDPQWVYGYDPMTVRLEEPAASPARSSSDAVSAE